jgi:hypothetical protein
LSVLAVVRDFAFTGASGGAPQGNSRLGRKWTRRLAPSFAPVKDSWTADVRDAVALNGTLADLPGRLTTIAASVASATTPVTTTT